MSYLLVAWSLTLVLSIGKCAESRTAPGDVQRWISKGPLLTNGEEKHKESSWLGKAACVKATADVPKVLTQCIRRKE